MTAILYTSKSKEFVHRIDILNEDTRNGMYGALFFQEAGWDREAIDNLADATNDIDFL